MLMNASVLSSSMTTIFLVFLTLGFLWGLWRGFSKSITRLLIVIAVAVATFFIVPTISHAIATANVSSLNLSVNGTPVQTLNEFVTEYLSSIPKINDLMNASPTFTEFIQVLPEILINIVLFIVFFFVVKMISMIIYWILCAIFFSKKKTAGKNKHRFIGGVIGGLQGLLVCCIIMIPMFGLINLAGDAEAALNASRTELEATVDNSGNTTPETFNSYIVETTSDEDSDDQNNSLTIDETLDTINVYINALKGNFIYKTLNTVGVVKLSNSMFDELTTIKVSTAQGSKNYKFTTEAVELSSMYPYLELIIDSDFDIQNNEFIDKIILLVNKSYDSPLLGDIISEIIQEAARIWTDTSIDRSERVFIGIAAPDLGSDDLNAVLDEQLVIIKNADKATLQAKLVDVLKIAQVANDTIKIADQVKESLSDISVENLESIFDMIVENETIKDVIKDVVTTDTLEELGINDVGTQTLIVDVMTNIIDSEDLDISNEVAATKEIFGLAEEINKAQDLNTKVELEQDKIDSLVDSFANSTVITELIKTKQEAETEEGVANPIKDLDISNSLSEETKTNLENTLSEKEMDPETKALLEQILLGKTVE